MSSTTASLGFSNEAFEAFLQARQEPDWLRDARAEAWRSFNVLPMPGQRDEEWMRTDIRWFKLDKFGLPTEAATSPSGTIAPGLLTQGVQLAGQVSALDSQAHSATLSEKWAKRGVLFGSLDQLVREHGDLIRPHLYRAVDPKFDKFSALHAAAWSGGTLLYVPRGVVVDEPLHTLSALSPGATDLGHTLVVLEDGAEATLLAESASLQEGTGGLHLGAVELIVGPNAKLR
jgi:Fe-S cluster assembly protein SufD